MNFSKQIWPTDQIIEHIPFENVFATCTLYTSSDFANQLEPGPCDFFANCVLLLNSRTTEIYIPWVKKVNCSVHVAFPHIFQIEPPENPLNLRVMHTPMKVYLDGAGIWHTVQESYNFSYFMFESIPLDLQSQPQHMRAIGITLFYHYSLLKVLRSGIWPDPFTNMDVAAHLARYFEILLKGVQCYHAYLEEVILLVPVLTLLLCDQQMGNPICAIKGPTGIQGNRHYHYPVGDYSVCFIVF